MSWFKRYGAKRHKYQFKLKIKTIEFRIKKPMKVRILVIRGDHKKRTKKLLLLNS